MIKLIAIDLDDTLLNSKKEISNENKEAITKATKQGKKVVITSGRPMFRIKPILEELQLNSKNDFVISFNGGMISNGDNSKCFHKDVLNNSDINKIVDVINKHDLFYNVYVDDDIYTIELEKEIIDMPVYKGINFKFSSNDEIRALDYSNKILIATTSQKILNAKNDIIKELSNFNVTQSHPNLLEILPKTVDKANGLKKLCELINIDKSSVMAIGDAENDLGMIEFAKYGVAMSNAIDSLKKKAYFITTSSNDSGVAFAINHFLDTEKAKK